MNIFEKTMKTWRIELRTRVRILAEAMLQKGIFQDPISLLLFIIVIIPLSTIFRKFTAGYKLGRSQDKIKHLMDTDVIKLFAKSEIKPENQIQAVKVYSQDIGMEFGMEKCAMRGRKS